MRCSRS